MKKSIRTLALFALFCSVACANAQSIPAVTLPTAPKIDGKFEPGEWEGAQQVGGFIDLNTDKPVSEQTKVFVAVDETFLYAAFLCDEPDQKNIISQTTQAGALLSNEDFIGIIVDPLNRKTWDGASQFRVNPNGFQSEQISGGRTSKREWRGEWQAKSSRTDSGWLVEMAIPWQILNFPEGKTGDVMINFIRAHEKRKLASFWANIGIQEFADRNGTLTGVKFPQSKSTKTKVELLGYISPEYDPDASPKSSLRAGLDIRIRPNATTTGVLSLNPDFKNIERSIAGIEFTRSERRLDDVRPFFTEGSGYFATSSRFAIGTVFYSNRIEDFDQGVKLFSDINSSTRFGLLATREDGDNFRGVFNFSKTLDSESSLRFYGTSSNTPGVNNLVLGSSGNVKKGNYDLAYDFAESRTDTSYGQAGALGLTYSIPKFFTLVKGVYIQPSFDAKLGLIPFTDKRGVYSYSEYNSEYRTGQFVQFHADLYAESFQKFDNSNLSRSIEAGTSLLARNNIDYSLRVGTDTFEKETSHNYSIGADFNTSNRFHNYGFSYSTGDIAGQPTSFISARGTTRIGKIDLGLRHSVFKLGSSTDQTILTAGYEIDQFRSITARFVKNNRDQNWYIAYRNAGGKGLEWYFIVGDPNARNGRERVALKMVWAR